MLSDEQVRHLEEMYRRRGYVLDVHRIMVENDFEWVKALDRFSRATYLDQRLLDRKTKELIQVTVEAALKADVEHIQEHVRLALDNGASPQEVIEALECVVLPMGLLAFRRGIQAWAAEVERRGTNGAPGT